MNKIFDKRQVLFLTILFFIALGIRTIYLLEFQHKNPLFDIISPAFDHSNFDIGAINFTKGDLLARSPSNSFAPLYKYFLGVIYLLFGRNFLIIYFIQFIMGSATAVLIYLITKDLFGNRAGIIAFFCFAFYSPQIIYEGIILRAAFISFFGVLSFYLLSRLQYSLTTGKLILTSLAWSLFIQGRPNVMLCLPLVCFFLYKIFYSLDREEKIKNWAICSATLFLSFIPMLLQCYLVWGKFVFFDANGPYAFIAGNIISYSGFGFNEAIINEYLKENELGYLSAISFLIDHISGNFTEFVKLYLRKTYYFLNDFEAPTNISIYIYRELSLTLSLLWGHFSLFSSLGLIGMLLLLKNTKRQVTATKMACPELVEGSYRHEEKLLQCNTINNIFLLYSYILSLSLAVIIFLNQSRYRIPVVPYFIIFSSYTIDLIITWISQKQIKKALITIFAAVILFIALLVPKNMNRIRAQDYNSMANAWMKKGDLDEAVKYLNKAIKDYPLYIFSYHNKGQYYLIKQDLVNAKLNFEKALVLGRQNHAAKQKMLSTLTNAGNQYLIKREYSNALELYSIIKRFDPKNIDVLINMGVCYGYLDKILEAKQLFEMVLEIDPNNSGAIKNLSMIK